MLSKEEWKRLKFWPGGYSILYDYRSELDPEDLCSECKGHGHIWPKDTGGAQAFCGGDCEDCEGTGLVEGEKRDRVLLTYELRDISTKEIDLDRLHKAINYLKGQ